MVKHFVEFYSPGTFLAEITIKEIDSWDVDKAVKMSKSIKERYNAKPYGFAFTTRERKENDFDSKETNRSGTYFLGGEILTIVELKNENEKNNQILINNMERNNWDKIVRNDNSWRWHQPLRENDIVLNI